MFLPHVSGTGLANRNHMPILTKTPLPSQNH